MSDLGLFSDYSDINSDVYDLPDSNIDDNTSYSWYNPSDYGSDQFGPVPISPSDSPTPNGNTAQNLFGSLFGTDTTGVKTPVNLQTGLTNLANTLFQNFRNPNQSPATSATAGNAKIGGVPVTTWLLIGGGALVLILLLKK